VGLLKLWGTLSAHSPTRVDVEPRQIVGGMTNTVGRAGQHSTTGIRSLAASSVKPPAAREAA
jgi:hypothetical protein